MDSHAYYCLEILRRLEDGPYLTNRMVAAKLGVSVKLAHSLFHGLMHRGLVHATRRDGRSMYYLVTPAGLREKVRLTYQFLEFSAQFFRDARRRSSEVCRDLARAGVRQVAFIGCGDLAEIAYLGVQEHGLVLSDVFDDQRAGESFLGMRVRSATELATAVSAAPGGNGFERVLVTAYDPSQPARGRYLPAGVRADERFVWVFGYAEAGPAAPAADSWPANGLGRSRSARQGAGSG